MRKTNKETDSNIKRQEVTSRQTVTYQDKQQRADRYPDRERQKATSVNPMQTDD